MMIRMVCSAVLCMFISSAFGIEGNLGSHDGYFPDGSQEYPYRIEDETDFAAYCDSSSYWDGGQYAELMGDIDLTGIEHTSSPIDYFMGHLNGNNFSIRHYTGSNAIFNAIGMNASVSNLKLVDISITFTSIGGGGLCNSLEGLIDSCCVTGQISGGYTGSGSVPQNFSVGGMAAGSYGEMGGYEATIQNSYTQCSIDLAGAYCVGGLIAEMSWGSHVLNSFSDSDISVDDGGYIGGCAGFSQDSVIENCYATGQIESPWGTVGGFVGYFEYASRPITCCFWDTEATGQEVGYTDYSYSHDITSKTTAEMKTQTTFTDWNFATVWGMCDTLNYPQLQWQIPAADIVCPCGVGTEDLMMLANEWLGNSVVYADLYVDGIVDLKDFAVLAKQWLQ